MVAQINNFLIKNTIKIKQINILFFIILLITSCSNTKKVLVKSDNHNEKKIITNNLKNSDSLNKNNLSKTKVKKELNLKINIIDDENDIIKNLVNKVIKDLYKKKYYSNNILITGKVFFKVINYTNYSIKAKLELLIQDQKTKENYQEIRIIEIGGKWSFGNSKKLVKEKILINLKKELVKNFKIITAN